MRRLIADDGSVARHLTVDRDTRGRPRWMKTLTQRMDPVMERVAQLKEKVNEAPKAGNRHNMHYLGTIPMTMLMTWLQKNGIRFDQFARNEDGAKDRFKQWFFTRDHAKLHTKGHLLKVPK